MTRHEAQARARELNLQLGRTDGEVNPFNELDVERAFYVEVECSPGVWTVEKRVERPRERNFIEKLWSAAWRSWT